LYLQFYQIQAASYYTKVGLSQVKSKRAGSLGYRTVSLIIISI